MFSHWKKRGFDFEATHTNNSKALLGLISLIALAYLIAHQWGMRPNQQKAIKKKAHGFLAKSLFRHGLDRLTLILKCIFQKESFVR